MQSAPWLTGWVGCPSTLTIRPSRFLARMPHPAGHSRHVVAYHNALPVTMSSGASTRVKRFLSALVLHPAAIEMDPIPAILRKVLRFMSSSFSLCNPNYLLQFNYFIRYSPNPGNEDVA